MPKFFYALLALLVSGSLFLSVHSLAASEFATIPSSLHACLPISPIPEVPYHYSLMGEVSNPDPTVTGDRPMQSFTLVEVSSPLGLDSYLTLIGLDRQHRCFNYIQRPVANLTLTAFMPPALAIEVAKQRYQHLVQQPGGEQRLELLLKATDYGWKLPPEDVVALRDLAYVIPANAQVLEALIPYRFHQS